ncbi:MAG: gamma carbonic anhydrase family protein [Deltaproteobacteria bacterium]|nr:gamma carbonic anhydrase family protein [Deltaproteobacteria bacterium]
MADGSLITPFDGHAPQIDPTAFVDPSARIIGRVTLAKGAMIWPGAVLRADDDRIVVGQGSAVLDLALLEAPKDKPVIVEPGALVSHQVCIHGATVKSGALVGIGAIVLDGAVVGAGALVGAGAVVPPRMEIPEGVLVLGQPAKLIRELKPAEVAEVGNQLADLAGKAKLYMS